MNRTQRISQTFNTMLKRQSRSGFTGTAERDQGDVMHAEGDVTHAEGDVMHAEGGILLAECGILHLEGRVNAIVEEDEISSISSCGSNCHKRLSDTVECRNCNGSASHGQGVSRGPDISLEVDSEHSLML